MRHSQESGFSLLGVVFSIGLMGVLSAGLSQMFTNGFRVQTKMEQDSGWSKVTDQIHTLLSNDKICRDSLQGFALNSASAKAFTVRSGNKSFVKAGDEFDRRVRVTTLEAETVVSEKGFATLEVRIAGKRLGKGLSAKTWESKAFLNALDKNQDGKIDSCALAGRQIHLASGALPDGQPVAFELGEGGIMNASAMVSLAGGGACFGSSTIDLFNEDGQSLPVGSSHCGSDSISNPGTASEAGATCFTALSPGRYTITARSVKTSACGTNYANGFFQVIAR